MSAGKLLRARAAPIGRIHTTSYLPDLNVWLALSWANHRHSDAAWKWFSAREADRFLFCRITQLGLLRLLVTPAIMGDDVCSVADAWKVYDRWMEDPRVDFGEETIGLNDAFRAATRPFARQSSPKALVDCFLLAASQSSDASLVTFDRALASACKKARHRTVLLTIGAD